MAESILNIMFDALNTIEGETNETKGMNLLAGMLALDDDKFEQVRPVLLESFNKSLNTPEAHLVIAQMFNVNGVKYETLVSEFELASSMIDDYYKDTISQLKKDFIKEILAIFVNAAGESEGISKRIINIPIELCREGAQLPTYATEGSAAMDIYATEDFTLYPGESKIIPTGLKVNIPKGYAILIHPRSGLSAKTHLRIANSIGLIDSDYHEEIGVILENNSATITEADIREDGVCANPLFGKSYSITKGDRIAQMRLIEVPMISWIKTDSIGTFNFNHGAGFGSTGK